MRLIDADKLLRFFTVDTANQTYRFGTIKKQIENAETVQAIPIPDNATNGDMIKAMFPKAWKSNYIDSDNKCTLYIDDDYGLEVDIDWWNAPYQRGKNLDNADKSGLEFADMPTLQSAT